MALVRGQVGFDACGRTTYTSYPYDATRGIHGATSSYDILGRPKEYHAYTGTSTHDDVSFAYAASQVTITDENNNMTRQVW